MSETMTVRATSLAMSAGFLAVIVLLALTYTYALPILRIVDGPSVTVERLPEPTPPPQPPVRQPIRTPIMGEPAQITTIDVTEAEPVAPTEFAPPGVPSLQTISDPHWLRRPRDLQRYYPPRALRLGVEGSVLLDCLVATTGHLRCSVISETPADWGFAAAALRIAADHQMTPAMRDGAPVEGRYRMRVPFRVE